jgi:exonuclease SbcC
MRKTRGQPTREDRDFANRHRPWRGSTWRVIVGVTLDDGRTIEINQDLGPGGRSTATDRGTNRPLTGDISQSGGVDGATLLGLTRETAIATLFVRQADMLRVLNQAGALQEYLQRAAATSGFDTTADEALARIAAYRKDQVGLLRVDSRGPIAMATRQLTEAREKLDTAEERFESYQQLLALRHEAELDVQRVEHELKEVAEHERERQRRERWAEIRAAERRLEQARQLTQQVIDTRVQVVDKQLVANVSRALTTFDTRPSEPPPLEGPTSNEVEAALATVPEMPAGDLEPSSEVSALLDQWRHELQRRAAHAEIEPSVPATPSWFGAPAELRRLAEELELRAPEVDPALVDEIEGRRSAGDAQSSLTSPSPAPSTAKRLPVLLVIGALLAVAGAGLLTTGQPAIGLAVILVGAALAVVGVLTRHRGASVAAIPATSVGPHSITTDPELPRLEARLVVQEEARAQTERRRDSAAARVTELGLPEDPSELRRLAAEGDAESTAEARHLEWQSRASELAAAEEAASEALRSSLSARGISLGGDLDLEGAFRRYTQQCRDRAGVARQAERRADLETQLASRRVAETAREQDRSKREAAEQQLLIVAQDAGCLAESIPQVADALRRWLAAQEEAVQLGQRHETATARLEQLLDGLTLDELKAEVGELLSGAGDPPRDDVAPPKDRSDELKALQEEALQLRETSSELVGQIEGAEKHLLDVSVAIESEARAGAEVARLAALAEDLDLASGILEAAQEKVNADIAPVLNETIRPWVPRITGGRYDDIRVNPATLEIEAHEAGGQFRTATVLSHGTTEQLFLLLRLALAQRLTTTDERAPIVLDDTTVQSDASRTVAALELLHELSVEHQVVLFSQEDEVGQWTEQHLHKPNDQLIYLSVTPSGPGRIA